MNTNVSIDVDFMDELPAKTLLQMVERAQTIKRFVESWKTTIREAAPLFRFLEAMDVGLRFDADQGYITCRFTGDGDRLAKVWAELRRNSYDVGMRPKKGDTEFNAFWKRDGLSDIFMLFSSSLCKRIQVGTQMVEQPVYETQCGEVDFSAIEGPKLSVVPAYDDIPF